jgi:hypothetical protein
VHDLQENVKAVQFLKEHDLSWRGYLELLLDVVSIEDFGEFALDVRWQQGCLHH